MSFWTVADLGLNTPSMRTHIATAAIVWWAAAGVGGNDGPQLPLRLQGDWVRHKGSRCGQFPSKFIYWNTKTSRLVAAIHTKLGMHSA
jgi:hypothetical protein